MDVGRASWGFHELVAVMPTYDRHGFASQVWLTDGTDVLVARRPRKIVERALRDVGMTWESYMARYDDTCYGKQYAPIVCAGHGFMTCQMIKPRATGDETYGYVRVDAVDDVVVRGDVGVMKMLDGREIVSVQSPITVARHRDRAASELLREKRARAQVEADSVQRMLAYAARRQQRGGDSSSGGTGAGAHAAAPGERERAGRGSQGDGGPLLVVRESNGLSAPTLISPSHELDYATAVALLYATKLQAPGDMYTREVLAQLLLQVSRDLTAQD